MKQPEIIGDKPGDFRAVIQAINPGQHAGQSIVSALIIDPPTHLVAAIGRELPSNAVGKIADIHIEEGRHLGRRMLRQEVHIDQITYGTNATGLKRRRTRAFAEDLRSMGWNLAYDPADYPTE